MLPRISPMVVAAALCAAFLFALPVAAQEDVTPPTLIDVSFEPSEIDTGKGPVTVTVTIHVEDDLSGLALASIYFHREGTTQMRMIEVDNRYLLEGETSLYQNSFVMPQYSAYGEWNMSGVSMTDKVGNYINLSKPAGDNPVASPAWPTFFNGFGFTIAPDDSALPFRVFVPAISVH